MSMNGPNPALRELGVVEREIAGRNDADRLSNSDADAAFYIAMATEPFLNAQLQDEAVAEAMMAEPDRQIDLSNDDEAKTYEYYLVAAYEEYKEREGEDAVPLLAYEHSRIRGYEFQRYGAAGDRELVDSLSVTQGFVANLAAESAKRNKYAASNAADLVFLKHTHQANIALLEAELSLSDQQTYANLKQPQELPMVVKQYEGDPNGLALYRRARFLIEAFRKRDTIRQLAQIFGTEVSADFSREDVKYIAHVVEQQGEDVTN